MMSKIYYVLLFSLVCASCSTNTTHRDELSFKGKVKTVKESYYNFLSTDSGIVALERINGESLLADPKTADEFLVYESQILFDPNGNIVYVTASDLTGANINYKETFKYENNKLAEKTGSNNLKDLYVLKYGYDDKGRQISEELVSNGTVFEKISSTYEGETLKSNVLVEEMNFSRETLMNKGKPLEIIYKDHYGSIIYKWKGNYNSKNLLTESVSYDASKEYQKEKFEYDKNNNEVKHVIYDTETNEIIASYSYKYIYDKKNNWTQLATIVNDEPFILIRREVTYF